MHGETKNTQRGTERTRSTAKQLGNQWVDANAAYSAAQMQKGQQIGNIADGVAQQNGSIWALTSGVTGSDQTGASIYGYRNAGDYVVDQTDSRQAEQKIRNQIADGGFDAVLHSLGARAMSGGKTLDSYNKFLEYSATGKITENAELTPGAYSEIVDEEVSNYLSKKYGAFAGSAYTRLSDGFDDVVSAAMGPIGVLKNSIDAAGEGLGHAKNNGATDQQAVYYGAVRGMSSAVNDLFFDDEKNGSVKTIGRGMLDEAKNLRDNIVQGMVEQVAQQIVLGENSDYNELVQSYYEKGFSKDQARKIAMNELRKNLVQEGISETLIDKAFDPIKIKTKRK